MTRAEVRERLSDLKAVYPREFGFMDLEQKKRLLDIWAREFADVPCKAFDTAIDEAKRRYKRLPSLAEIRDLLPNDAEFDVDADEKLEESIRSMQCMRSYWLQALDNADTEDKKKKCHEMLDKISGYLAIMDRKKLEAMQRKGMIT